MKYVNKKRTLNLSRQAKENFKSYKNLRVLVLVFITKSNSKEFHEFPSLFLMSELLAKPSVY